MKGIVFLFTSLFLLTVTGNAQFIDSTLSKAQRQFALEKVYIQYNKQDYFSGDTIWFKSYIQTDGDHSLSSTLKIELLNTNGLSVSQGLFPVFDGTATGQLIIPKNIGSGRYFIRAFTNSSVGKQDPSLAFVQPLFIRHDLLSPAPVFEQKSALTAHWSSEIQPVLTGISNELFFSITDQFCQPVAADVYLVSGKNDTVCTTTSSEYGIGKLIFTATEGETYTAVVCRKNDSLHYSIPSAREGIDLSANPVSNSYYINISQTSRYRKQPAYLVGEMNFSKVFAQPLSGKKQQNIILATDSLPTGILRLLVLDAGYNALTEKFVFIYHPDSAIVFADRNTIITETVDTNWISNKILPKVETNISVAAVYEGDQSFVYPKQNIAARMWFTGYFKQPMPVINASFATSNTTLLHTCNTYLNVFTVRKPGWSQILLASPVTDTIQKPAYLHFSGKMVDRNNNPVSVKNGTLNLILQTADSAKKYWSIPVAADGSFREEGLVFSDSAKIFYRLTGDLDNDKKVLLNSSGLPTTEMHFANDDLSFLSDYVDLQIDTVKKETNVILPDTSKIEKPMSAAQTLADVSVTGYKTLRQKTNELEKRYVKGVFDKEATFRIDLVNDPPLNKTMSVRDYILLNYPHIFRGRELPLALYLNEGPTTKEELSFLAVNQVALVKYYRNFVLASGKDAIVVYLKKTEDTPSIQHESIGKSFFVLAGYSPSFVSPTVYWNPEMILGNNQPSKIALPNKAKSQNIPLLITIEGMDVDGMPVYYSRKIPMK